MGSENSKVDRTFKCDNEINKSFVFMDKGEERKPCTLLGECSVDSWKNGHAEAANFSETLLYCDRQLHKECSPAFCTTRQRGLNVHKNAVFPFKRKAKFAKMAEHFEYNYIPAQMSSVHRLKFKSILCYRDSKVIVHLSRQGVSQFGFLDLKVNKFRKFGQKLFECANYKLSGEISPDGSKCLISKLIVGSIMPERVTDLRAKYRSEITTSNSTVREEELDNKYGNLNSFSNSGAGPSAMTDVIELLLYDLNTFELLSIVRLELLRTTSVCKFSFDPRHAWKRIAVTSFTVKPENTLSLIEFIPPDDYKKIIFDANAEKLPNNNFNNNNNSTSSISSTLKFDLMKQEQNFSTQEETNKSVQKWLWCISESNYKFNDISDNQKTISTSFRLRDQLPLPPPSTSGSVIADLRYSPDGRLLVITVLGKKQNCFCAMAGSRRLSSYIMMDGSEIHVNCDGKSFDCYLYVLDGNTADTIHCIQYNRNACLWHTCPTNYAPIFSMCSTRIAVAMDVVATVNDSSVNRLGDITNRHKFYLHGPHVIQVYRLPYNAFSLQSMCRSILLESGMDLGRLDLPPKIVDYLRYTPEYKY